MQKEASQLVKFARIQSPSSINTYKLCPRKYYYNYIRKLETLPSIHLTRGKIVHAALEEFFKFDITKVPVDGHGYTLKVILHEKFKERWSASLKELSSFGLSMMELKHYFNESLGMLDNFHQRFMVRLDEFGKKYGFHPAFKMLAPETEKEYRAEGLGVRGFIDAIHKIEDEIILMDYKTSKSDILTEEYKLQLAIYALLYTEKHGISPDKVGINFLKFNEQLIAVDKDLLDFARKEVELIHRCTQSEDMKDYPKNIGPYCKWSSGQCDFYNTCVKE